MYLIFNQGDINADGQTDLVITYLLNNTYTSQIYSSKCSPSCVLTAWTTDLTVMSGMEAVPFIFDRFSNGSVSIFTLKAGQRVIVTAIPSQNTMYPSINSATRLNGQLSSPIHQLPSKT
jgi:hypothetical protein